MLKVMSNIESASSLKNELSCKVGFSQVVRDPLKLQIFLIISSGCGMSKVIENNMVAISQK